MTGFAAARWYPHTPEKSPAGGSQRRLPDHRRCSKHPDYTVALSPFSRRPALAATTHPQPLAQTIALRHPGFRCDIDSHPDCRSLLTLIVAPQRGERRSMRPSFPACRAVCTHRSLLPKRCVWAKRYSLPSSVTGRRSRPMRRCWRTRWAGGASNSSAAAPTRTWCCWICAANGSPGRGLKQCWSGQHRSQQEPYPIRRPQALAVGRSAPGRGRGDHPRFRHR